MRADEYAESLQWNICRGTVASVLALVEHAVPLEKYLWSLDAPIHDPELKLNLETIPGIYQCGTAYALSLTSLTVIAGTTLVSSLPHYVSMGKSCL